MPGQTFFADFSRLHASLLAAVDLRDYFSKQIISVKTAIVQQNRISTLFSDYSVYNGSRGKSGFRLDS